MFVVIQQRKLLHVFFSSLGRIERVFYSLAYLNFSQRLPDSHMNRTVNLAVSSSLLKQLQCLSHVRPVHGFFQPQFTMLCELFTEYLNIFIRVPMWTICPIWTVPTKDYVQSGSLWKRFCVYLAELIPCHRECPRPGRTCPTVIITDGITVNNEEPTHVVRARMGCTDKRWFTPSLSHV